MLWIRELQIDVTPPPSTPEDRVRRHVRMLARLLHAAANTRAPTMGTCRSCGLRIAIVWGDATCGCGRPLELDH